MSLVRRNLSQMYKELPCFRLRMPFGLLGIIMSGADYPPYLLVGHGVAESVTFGSGGPNGIYFGGMMRHMSGQRYVRAHTGAGDLPQREISVSELTPGAEQNRRRSLHDG